MPLHEPKQLNPYICSEHRPLRDERRRAIRARKREWQKQNRLLNQVRHQMLGFAMPKPMENN